MGKIRNFLNKRYCRKHGHHHNPLLIGVKDIGYLDLVVMCPKCNYVVFLKRVHLSNNPLPDMLLVNNEALKLLYLIPIKNIGEN
jgi:hypothetical protein